MASTPSNVADIVILEFENKLKDQWRPKANNTKAFNNIQRKFFTNGLRSRIHNAGLIKQGHASLCGPAAVMYCWASKHPDKYARYAIDLFEKGKANFGSISVTPRNGTKEFTPQTSSFRPKSKIVDVDWITLASLRDSENIGIWPFGYTNESDQFAGITLPSEMEKWFKKVGFKVKENNTNIIFDASFKTLCKAISHYRAGRMVVLFIGMNVLAGGGGGKTIPDHWVVLTSDVTIDGRLASTSNTSGSLLEKTIDADVYTWGDDSYNINKGRTRLMPVKEFLDYFYGFIAVE